MNAPRKIRDVISLDDISSLDKLIEDLIKIQYEIGLDEDSESHVSIWSDEFFGQRITIKYSRLQTKEEVEIEQRYNRKRRKSNRA